MRVLGRVYRYGLPLTDWELTFHAAGSDPHTESDWDITDDDGHFEVTLPAGSYAVRSGDLEWWAVDLLVPPSEGGFTIDFDLPF